MSPHPLDFAAAAALLLWGLWVVRGAVLQLAGARLEQALARHAGRPARLLPLGIIGGAMLPPGPLLARLTPLLARRRLAAADALLVLLGAEVGTALAAMLLLGGTGGFQLLALAGVALVLGWPERAAGQLGRALLGSALALLSLFLLTAAAAGWAGTAAAQPLAALASDLPLAAVFGGTLAFLLRSGLAVVLLAATLAAAAALAPEPACALAIGASVSSALLPLSATAGAPDAAREAALAHLACRLLAALPALALVTGGTVSAPAAAVDPALLLGGGYLLLTSAGTLAFAWMAPGLTALAARCSPAGATRAAGPSARSAPDAPPRVAMAAVTREAVRLADQVERMVRGMLQVLLQDDDEAAARLRAMDDEVDAGYRRIQRELAALRQQPLATDDGRRWGELMAFTIALEQVADAVERLLRDYQRRTRRGRLALGEQALAELCGLHTLLLHHLRLAVGVLLQRDAGLAQALADTERAFADLARGYAALHLQRLAGDDPDHIASSAAYLDMVGDLERMNQLLCGLGRGFQRLHATPAPAATPA